MAGGLVKFVVVGEQFLKGETWTSPRGKVYKVLYVEPWTGTRVRRARLFCEGKSILRQWDAVEGWVRDPKPV